MTLPARSEVKEDVLPLQRALRALDDAKRALKQFSQTGSGGRTRSRKTASADGSFAAPSESATITTCGAFRALRPKSTRQRKTMLVATPWRRQTCATLAPAFSVSCTIARFCSSLKRRRFDRPSAASGVKRYLRRAQLAALLN